jgi:uncharacterized protein (TIGR02266 family)
MTQTASQTGRPVPPPLPTSYTSGEGSARPLSQLVLAGEIPSLRNVWIRPEPAPAEQRESSSPVEAELKVEFVQDSHFVAGLSQDLSKGAFFVATYQTLPIGTEVRVGIELPNGHGIEALGVVHWLEEDASASERPGIGVLFTEIAPGAVAAIAEYCQLRPPLYHDL